MDNLLFCRQMNNMKKKVFRYKFSNDVMELMQDFSKVHQNDSKDNFDDNWTLFLEKNKQVIETEERRLKECGFDASIEDKMYKSIKYYYNKKKIAVVDADANANANANANADANAKERRKYVSVGHDVLISMQVHIRENIKKEDYKPDKGFNEFIKDYDLKKDGDGGDDEFKRYKKAYKNMYYRTNVS